LLPAQDALNAHGVTRSRSTIRSTRVTDRRSRYVTGRRDGPADHGHSARARTVCTGGRSRCLALGELAAQPGHVPRQRLHRLLHRPLPLGRHPLAPQPRTSPAAETPRPRRSAGSPRSARGSAEPSTPPTGWAAYRPPARQRLIPSPLRRPGPLSGQPLQLRTAHVPAHRFLFPSSRWLMSFPSSSAAPELTLWGVLARRRLLSRSPGDRG